MARLRKMLGSADSPYILSLMRVIETQSKTTIVTWCLDYALEHILPIYKKACPLDNRPAAAVKGARQWLLGNVKLPYVKKLILEAHAAARELEQNPRAQAAARALGQAAATVQWLSRYNPKLSPK